jgi:hypothetical protein
MRIFVLFLLISCNLIAQDKTKSHHDGLVEAYYDKESTNPLYIYDSVNGKVIDTLKNIEDEYAWYKIVILESEYGWFKIKNIQRLPNSHLDFGYENHWVKITDFLVTIDNYDDNHIVYLYDQPSTKSNRIHKLDNYQIVNVIETSDLWANVTFMVGKKRVNGWLSYKDQCAYPWTTCPKYH